MKREHFHAHAKIIQQLQFAKKSIIWIIIIWYPLLFQTTSQCSILFGKCSLFFRFILCILLSKHCFSFLPFQWHHLEFRVRFPWEKFFFIFFFSLIYTVVLRNDLHEWILKKVTYISFNFIWWQVNWNICNFFVSPND